jgi:hypothetical protein
MTNNDAYEYIYVLHDNPDIIVLKGGILIDNMKCFIYTLGANSDEWIVTHEEIGHRYLQLELFK